VAARVMVDRVAGIATHGYCDIVLTTDGWMDGLMVACYSLDGDESSIQGRQQQQVNNGMEWNG